MSLPVSWTETAETQLQGIYRYTAQNSQCYAIGTVERIMYHIRSDRVDIIAVIRGAGDDVT